ncbi:MAG: hypothetical protein COW11_05885 [Candidatus Omnitrophica bacterium CG12_big_fil_rev_8_21_14_0_65_43_15]|uniref:Phosphoribosyltransferase domain-containing protein n=1 Tax=Candidatus Taenaricola geysiri TaxID=1974752 RepID=A0A2J0LIT9_9BACT|nr:MAG: hypothetical protein AUJ89_05875 [Candidatus Omnitrophica bacterium CG1_02_43_210]PIV12386.1 MAG: hypothetical protein COS48_01035 [Candidatus Omnitrophica bacterium CG03_land_8_20_14_0_80_43_22]PIW65950.1 MAG: hypothetical protein COW11_05885 [Candidatus Omnitrophica bacterium CG12_big_fil_rev_8_21_14_0_65_43_15]PIW80152.1 MAG: hypothetical protein COZ98_03820 [Candidatus Omnitrophica bacterium CG_4_8_14_3_um_filter_43_15]
MIGLLRDLFSGIVNLLYPALCETCQEKIDTESNAGALCKNCLAKLKTLKPQPGTQYSNIKVWAACEYKGIAKNCIHLFKYNNRQRLSGPLAGLMSDLANKNPFGEKFDLIIPIPLHRSKMRERGFNQAELLAKNMAKSINAPVCVNALKKTKATISQAGLSKTKRFTNLRGTFKITDSDVIYGKDILLVDDVCTTGSTINEAAKVLLKSGAKSVKALVLAKGI